MTHKTLHDPPLSHEGREELLQGWVTRFERKGFLPHLFSSNESRDLRLARIGMFIAIPLLALGAAIEICFFVYVIWECVH